VWASSDDERGLEFLGFLTFLDHPKEGAGQTIADLAGLDCRSLWSPP
jgi:magnesium-transporting ATPase (P-type)